jgi:hypothetical protein
MRRLPAKRRSNEWSKKSSASRAKWEDAVAAAEWATVTHLFISDRIPRAWATTLIERTSALSLTVLIVPDERVGPDSLNLKRVEVSTHRGYADGTVLGRFFMGSTHG